MFGGRRGEEGFLYKSSQSVAVLQGRSLQQPLLPFPITGSTNTRISVNAILLNEGWGVTKLIALRMDPHLEGLKCTLRVRHYDFRQTNGSTTYYCVDNIAISLRRLFTVRKRLDKPLYAAIFFRKGCSTSLKTFMCE